MTFYTLLRLHKRIKSRRLKLLGLLIASRTGMRHLSVRIDPVMGCNLACRMCYFSSSDYRKQNKGILSLDEMEEIARVLFPRAFQLVVGCGAEPTKHPEYKELFRLATKYKVPDVGVVTNGQLLKMSDLEVMKETGVNEIMLSTHGVTKATYEKFMTGASFEKLHEVLGNIQHIRDGGDNGSSPSVRINYTVNPDNLKELKDFFPVFGHYGIDTLQVRPIMDIGGRYTKQFSEEELPEYNEIIQFLKEECGKHKVKFLANTMDASYQVESNDSDISELVYTHISPKTTGQLNIEWKSSTFKKFRKADGWTRQLMKALVQKSRGGGWMSKSLKYEELAP